MKDSRLEVHSTPHTMPSRGTTNDRLARGGRHFLVVAVGLLLLFWATRLIALESFPPFVDEVFHLEFGRMVVSSGILDRAEEGRQFTVWWYVLFAAQTNNTVWVARAATLLAVLPGFAAAAALGRMAAGAIGGVLVGLLYVFSTYHFFFERLALADPVSASAAVVALAFAYRYRFRIRLSDAVLCGLALFVSVGAKISALPYFAIPVLAALTLRHRPHRDAARWGGAALLTAVSLTGIYIAVLFWRGRNVFYYLQTGGRGEGVFETLARNFSTSFDTLSGYGGVIAALLLLAGVIVLVARRRFFLPLCFLLPLCVLALSARQDSRHIVAPITILLICGGAALGQIAQTRALKGIAVATVLAWGLLNWLPFAYTGATAPSELPLPAGDVVEYMNSEGSGVGIRETAALLTEMQTQRVIGILANCFSLRTISQGRLNVECPRLSPSGEDIETLSALMDDSRAEGTYAGFEQLSYAPPTVPGELVAVIDVRQPPLAIYHLAP